MKKKVLIVTPHYYPEQFKITEIAEHLAKEFDVDVWTNIPNYPKGNYYSTYGVFKRRFQTINGVNIKRLFVIPRKRNIVMLSLNYLSFLVSGLIRSLFTFKKYDIVLTYSISPITSAVPNIVISWRMKVPHILYVQDIWPESLRTIGISEKSIIYRIAMRVSSYIYRRVSNLIVSSNSFKRYFKEKYNIDSTYIPNFSESIFEDLSTLSDDNTHSTSKKTKILFAGNIGMAQNLDVYISLARNLKLKSRHDFEFIFLGDGSYKKEFIYKIYELELSSYFKFIPRVPINEVPKYYQAADILTASLSFDDVISLTLPSKIQSYLATGKPIFSVGHGEIDEIINQFPNCLNVPSLDEQKILEMFLRFIETYNKDDDYRQMYEDMFNRERILNQISDILR